MFQSPNDLTTKVGDLIQLVSPTNKSYIFRLNQGGQIQTHRGVINHDDLIGVTWGSEVFSHQGSTYFILKPTISDLLLQTKRNTQIMYPKDIGYTLLKLGIGHGGHVIEAGTGSGAMTLALAWSVGSDGKVFSYEVREEMQNLARKNVARLGIEDRVTFKLKDINEGFEERNVDVVFLDLPNPYDYIGQAREALKPGGSFGCILPTTNQVARILQPLYRFDFVFTEVCEIMLRFYKPVSERLRPTDRMVAHTGYLVFARSAILAKPSSEMDERKNDINKE